MKKFDKKLSEYQIFLIGGANGVGTSWFAMELAQYSNIRSVIGTDSIREIMRQILPKHINPGIFNSTFLSGRGPDYHDLSKTRRKERIISGYIEQVRLVQHGIDAIIRRSLEEGIRTIIEGIHIVPRNFENHKYFGEYAGRIMQISVDVEDQEVHKKRFYTREDFAPSRSKKKYLSNFQEIRWIREYLVKEAKSNKKVMRLINHEGPEKIISKFKSKLMKVRPEKFQRISLNTFAGLINIYFENNDLKRIAFNKKDDTLDEIISEYTEYSEKSDEKIRPEYIINTEYIESPDQIDTVMATDPLLAGKPALLYIKKYLKAVPIQDSIEFTAYITEVIAKSGSSIFQKKVWQTLLTIPFGKTLTYGEIAQKMGMPNSARAVGAACGKNPFPILVPCHRVVAQKSLGGFSSGLKIKKKLLEFEKNNS